MALGIPVPGHWAELLERVVGRRVAEDWALRGRLVDADEARAAGALQAVVRAGEGSAAGPGVAAAPPWRRDRDACVAWCVARAAEALRHPDAGRAATKTVLRGDFAARWRDGCAEAAAAGWDLLCVPETRDTLGATLARLSGGTRRAKL